MNEILDFQYILDQVGPLEMAFKGMIIGIVASAPMGPVGVLCVQRTLNKGRWYGFATGVGAAISDLIYAAIAGFGMSFVVDIIENPIIAYWIKVAGSILLFIFGVWTFRSNPAQQIRPVSKNKSNLVHNFITGFLVTLSNPLILFLFVAMFGQFTFVVNNFVPQIVGYVFIVVGALLWWFGLTWLINKVRNRFDVRGIWIINRVIGVIVMVVSAAVAISVLTGNFFSFN
jgi:threonine/homoserine/homoserine lactone efflux protein